MNLQEIMSEISELEAEGLTEMYNERYMSLLHQAQILNQQEINEDYEEEY